MRTAYEIYNDMRLCYRRFKAGGPDASKALKRIEGYAIELMRTETPNPFSAVGDNEKHGPLYNQVTGKS